MQSATFAQPERLFRARDVWQRLGVSRSTFYALVRDEKFPAGKKGHDADRCLVRS